MSFNVSNNFLKLLYVLLGILFLISIGLNVWLLVKENEYKVIERIVTMEVRDTIHDTIPEVRYEKVLCYKHDTLRIVKELPGDTINMVVEVPITQKEYSDDSTYRAWISGYDQRLDSIDIYRKTIYVEKMITKKKKQKFVIGPHVGVGYDMKNNNISPTVGIGVTYNLFGF